MENKNNKKKILIGSIIIVLILLLVVVGSTYAYFSLQVNGEGTSTKVTITTGSNKQIKLSGGLEDFHIRLDVKDMAYNRIDREYYATSDSKLPYVTNKEDGLTEIGKVEVIGDLEEKHVCTAKAKVNLSGDMASLIREGDLEISLINGIYTNITDLTKINEKFPAELEFVITDTNTQYIKAYLKFTNRNDDQSYLAKRSLNVDIIIDEFKCNTDSEAPTVSEFYFNEKVDGQQYTNSLENILHLSWSDNDVTDYCITTNDSYEGCQWKPTNGQQSIQENITLEEREGDHTYYGYLKDKIGNISTQVTASIIYDVTPPSIDTIEDIELGETSVTLKVNANTDLSGIDKYCYSTNSNSTDVGTCVTSTDGNITISNLQDGTSYTYYFYLTDKAGNSGISNKTSHTFETESFGITGQDLINDRTKISTLQDNPVNGLYRYYGKYDVVDNNYICLGPSGNTCQSDEDKNKYMYRIIGIADGTESGSSKLDIDKGQIKVIKAISIGKYPWHNNYLTDTDWDEADLQRNLNSALFYNDTTKLDTRIKSKIKEVKWYKGKVTYLCDYSADCPPEQEKAPLTIDAYPIGLMYASDYYKSWGGYSGDGNTDSWLYITNGTSTSDGEQQFEWTMTRYGHDNGDFNVWYVRKDGSFYAGDTSFYDLTYLYVIRPVFYLQSNVKLTGEGTESNPYIPS